MTHLMKSLSVAALLALAAPSIAQNTDDTAGGEGEGTKDPLALSMGEEEVKTGDIYLKGEYTDWELRCVKTESGKDPCQLYQLLGDEQGNSVAEINIFPVGGEGQPAAGATVITPLETLLTQQLGLSVDGSAVRKYPFSWCSAIGCFSRIGFSEADLGAFRKGANATLHIVPVIAPDQTIKLNVSLSGFTAGFNAVVEANADN